MNRTLRLPLLLALLTLVACSEDRPRTSPTAPLAPPPPTQPSPSSSWALTETLISAWGPADNCMIRDLRSHLGSVWETVLDVTLEGEDVSFLYNCGDQFDYCEYSGTLRGQGFEAEGAASGGTFSCGGLEGTGDGLPFEVAPEVSGEFAADFWSLTGIERWTYRIGSEKFVVEYSWSAKRRGP